MKSATNGFPARRPRDTGEPSWATRLKSGRLPSRGGRDPEKTRNAVTPTRAAVAAAARDARAGDVSVAGPAGGDDAEIGDFSV
jgi:hypothetical protein